MALREIQTKTVRLVPSLACTIPYLAGMALLYAGERLFETPLTSRLVLDGIGAAAILWALAARTTNWARAGGDARAVEGMFLLGTLGGVAALKLYALGLAPVHQTLLPWLEQAATVNRVKGVLQALWPILWLSSVLPVIFMEVSYASMAGAPQIEKRRVGASAASGLTIAWVLAALFLLNYVAAEHNRKWDLSLLQTASPSADAEKLVSNLQDVFEVVLFYPEANEVREQLAGYFEDLGRKSDLFQVRIYDQVLEPKKAEELGAQKNGTLVYRYGDKKESIPIGLETDQAQSKLAKLDKEFQEKFLKLVSEQRLAYFVTGHGERRYDWSSEEDPRAPVKGLKAILRGQNFEIKPLGLAQGLASEVPLDASLLLVVDPEKDFLPEEIRSLEQYLDRGGRLWLILDPDSSSNVSGVPERYGLKFVSTPLANDRYYMRARHNKSDEYNLFTNRTSSHPSVNTLSRNSTQLAAVFLKTGCLEKTPGLKADVKVVMTLRTMPGTWVDESRELKTEPQGKDQKTFDLMAAVSMPVSATAAAGEDAAARGATGGTQPEPGSAEPSKAGKPATGAGDETKPPGPEGKEKPAKAKETAGAAGMEMRMLVLADADAVSDTVLGNLGNYYLFNDGLQWLLPEESLAGGIGVEEDVRIMHTKEKDLVWFYVTIFAVPLTVLALGIVYNRFRVRRKGRG